MKEIVASIFEALKNLEMPPTPKNVSIMNGVYEQLRIIYKELEDMKDVGTENGPAVDPE